MAAGDVDGTAFWEGAAVDDGAAVDALVGALVGALVEAGVEHAARATASAGTRRLMVRFTTGDLPFKVWVGCRTLLTRPPKYLALKQCCQALRCSPVAGASWPVRLRVPGLHPACIEDGTMLGDLTS
jgi:hypothetical protein